MTTIARELTVEEKSIAMIAPKATAIRVGDDDCFAPVAPRKPVKRILALGTALAGQPVVIKTAVNELDAMAADLTALRAGDVEPVVTMDAIEDENIGEAFSSMPYSF